MSRYSTTLLQDVLKPHGLQVDSLQRKLAVASLHSNSDDSEDELVNVVSAPGTPSRSHAPSRASSRPPSPTKGASAGAFGRPAPKPLHITTTRKVSTDPLKALPTEVGQKIFALLSISDLAKCARVSKKWLRSQTINYVWFQHYRRDKFHDESLPPGKWTRRESKQNWRIIFLQSLRASLSDPITYSGTGSSTPHDSGYQTPREVREEKWRQENVSAAKPSKLEMREMYKELGGRKVRGKGKISGAIRDRGGWGEGEESY